jgi:hypothetical protein
VHAIFGVCRKVIDHSMLSLLGACVSHQGIGLA